MGKKKRESSELLKAFGSRVRALRKVAGLSQMKLGEKVGLDHTYIGGIERGERNLSLEAIGKIAMGLGIEIPELFFLSGAERKPFPGELMELVTLLEKRDPETIQRGTEFVQGMLKGVDGVKTGK